MISVDEGRDFTPGELDAIEMAVCSQIGRERPKPQTERKLLGMRVCTACLRWMFAPYEMTICHGCKENAELRRKLDELPSRNAHAATCGERDALKKRVEEQHHTIQTQAAELEGLRKRLADGRIMNIGVDYARNSSWPSIEHQQEQQRYKNMLANALMSPPLPKLWPYNPGKCPLCGWHVIELKHAGSGAEHLACKCDRCNGQYLMDLFSAEGPTSIELPRKRRSAWAWRLMALLGTWVGGLSTYGAYSLVKLFF